MQSLCDLVKNVWREEIKDRDKLEDFYEMLVVMFTVRSQSQFPAFGRKS